VDTQNEYIVDLVKSVYSMIALVQIIHFISERETDKMEWGESKRGRKREPEKQMKGVRDSAAEK
jgi:hypothetical protein